MKNNELVMVDENEMVMVQHENTGLAMEGNDNFIADLTSERTLAYSSIDISKGTFAEKKQFFNAINSTDKRVGDEINAIIKVKHVYVEVVTCTNAETGEVKKCPRTVLIDEKGVGYQAVSTGVFSSLKKIFQTFGTPDKWGNESIPVKVKQVTKGNNKILTLEIA